MCLKSHELHLNVQWIFSPESGGPLNPRVNAAAGVPLEAARCSRGVHKFQVAAKPREPVRGEVDVAGCDFKTDSTSEMRQLDRVESAEGVVVVTYVRRPR